jgi:hypothetical protein
MAIGDIAMGVAPVGFAGRRAVGCVELCCELSVVFD